MADQTPSSQDYNNSEAAKWDSTRDAYLVEQLLYHERIGRRPHSVWSKEAWRETCAAFNLKFGTSYNVKVFKNRLTKLKDQFNTLKELTREKGFHWDDRYHMVTAENTVWDDYIKVCSSVLLRKRSSCLDVDFYTCALALLKLKKVI